MSLPLLTLPSAEDEAVMRTEARGCSSCLDWHKHCGAECCQQFTLADGKYNLSQRFITVPLRLNVDLIWYYELHGCSYSRGFLKVPTKNIVRKNGQLVVLERCAYLTDELKCKGHELGRKPKVCRNLTLENIQQQNISSGTVTSVVTPRCMFNWQ